MQKISSEDVFNIVWKACDTFRGVVDPSEYKNYILVFLFLKYLSDVWKEKLETFEKEYKGDKERIKRRLDREKFVIPKHSTFDFIFNQKDNDNIGEVIDKALSTLEDENKAKLDGVFRNISFNSESNLGKTKDRNKRLKNLILDFAVLDLSPSNISGQDIIGDSYEYLIAKFASDAGKKGGEFYTPKEVSILLAKLLNPKKGSKICDPACGSGSLLIKVASEIGSNDFSLYGQESNGSTWALCKMNMFLHEMDNARIEWADTITNPHLIENDSLMKFDIVVANPPFSLDKWGADDVANDKFKRFHRGIPPKSKGDFAFITHMVETCNYKNGKVGVIVPHGVLFRGSSEGKIRKALVEENLLEAVIGLPPNLFYGTGIPAAILIFNRGKKHSDVLFIDASREFESGKNQNSLRDEDIQKIVKTYKAFENVEKYSYRANLEEIGKNEFNLNIPRYVDTFEEEEEINIKAILKEIDGYEIQLSKVKSDMDKYLKKLGFER